MNVLFVDSKRPIDTPFITSRTAQSPTQALYSALQPPVGSELAPVAGGGSGEEFEAGRQPERRFRRASIVVSVIRQSVGPLAPCSGLSLDSPGEGSKQAGRLHRAASTGTHHFQVDNAVSRRPGP